MPTCIPKSAESRTNQIQQGNMHARRNHKGHHEGGRGCKKKHCEWGMFMLLCATIFLELGLHSITRHKARWNINNEHERTLEEQTYLSHNKLRYCGRKHAIRPGYAAGWAGMGRGKSYRSGRGGWFAKITCTGATAGYFEGVRPGINQARSKEEEKCAQTFSLRHLRGHDRVCFLSPCLSSFLCNYIHTRTMKWKSRPTSVMAGVQSPLTRWMMMKRKWSRWGTESSRVNGTLLYFHIGQRDITFLATLSHVYPATVVVLYQFDLLTGLHR